MSRISRLFPAKPRQRAGLWLLAALATIAMLTGVVARTGAGRDMPMIARLDDALAALIARSPGERAAGAVGKTRRAAASGDESSPAVERALGKIFPAQYPDLAIAPVGPLAVGDLMPLPLIPARGPSSPGRPTGPVIGPGGGGSPGGPLPQPTSSPTPTPSSGPTDTPSGQPSGPTSPDTPVGVVPEPAAWLLATVGFGVLGAAMRRRGRRLRGATGG